MNTLLLDIDDIDRQQVIAALGYGRDNPPSQQLLERLDEITGSIPVRIEGLYVGVDIVNRGKGFVVTSKATINSPTFCDLSDTADQVFFCLVTIGPEIDQRMESSEDMVDTLILDTVGSILVEQGVDAMRQKLARQTGKHVSLPFSPGYCDYPLNEQENIFKVLGDAPLGVSYHQGSYMMNPIKTISFITAAGDSPLKTNPCSICQLSTCNMRR